MVAPEGSGDVRGSGASASEMLPMISICRNDRQMTSGENTSFRMLYDTTAPIVASGVSLVAVALFVHALQSPQTRRWLGPAVDWWERSGAGCSCCPTASLDVSFLVTTTLTTSSASRRSPERLTQRQGKSSSCSGMLARGGSPSPLSGDYSTGASRSARGRFGSHSWRDGWSP